jgi:EAL domain-containing protein (putative c-di-GMP-specific phosphodiesterase class I)
MGHNLGCNIVAEGVEIAEQYRLLQELGVDAVQGFLFSKPVVADEISKIFNHKFFI